MKGKICYLTMDDSPSKNTKEKIDYLKSKKIPAVIFCIGKETEKNQEPLIYAIKKGFIIGNHSYSHPFFSKISLKNTFREIEKTDKIIEKLYKKAGKKRPIKLFRFPFGDKGDKIGDSISCKSPMARIKSTVHPKGKEKKEIIQKYLGKLGYKQPKFEGINYSWWEKYKLDKDRDVFWTYNLEEYRLPIGKVIKKINKINKKSSEILLIHDHSNTKKQFLTIIDKLIEKKIKVQFPKI